MLSKKVIGFWLLSIGALLISENADALMTNQEVYKVNETVSVTCSTYDNPSHPGDPYDNDGDGEFEIFCGGTNAEDSVSCVNANHIAFYSKIEPASPIDPTYELLITDSPRNGWATLDYPIDFVVQKLCSKLKRPAAP